MSINPTNQSELVTLFNFGRVSRTNGGKPVFQLALPYALQIANELEAHGAAAHLVLAICGEWNDGTQPDASTTETTPKANKAKVSPDVPSGSDNSGKVVLKTSFCGPEGMPPAQQKLFAGLQLFLQGLADSKTANDATGDTK